MMVRLRLLLGSFLNLVSFDVVMRYWVLILLVVLILILSFKFVYIEKITGNVVNNGIITLTKVGVAGIQADDDIINFGSGYVNNCEYAIVNSNGTENCWVNTSAFLVDAHEIVNNGTSILNITASLSGFTNAEEFFCGTSCDYTNNAQMGVYSVNNEESSCTGLTLAAEDIADYNSLSTVGICDYFDYSDLSDSLKVYVELYVPKDAAVGNKSFLIDYTATAY